MINQLKKYSLSAFIAMLLTACGTDPRDVYPKKLIESSCSNNFVQINKQATVSDLYMDRAYINMMIPRINHSVHLGELIELFFKMRLNSLETKNNDFGGELVLNTVTYSTKEIIALRYSENVIRISIKPIGSKECGNYELVTRYPAQEIPWLRKLGLQPDSCVAIERIPAITAPTRIYVDRQLIAKQYNGNSTQWRFDTTLVDTSSNPAITLASMTDHYAFSSSAKGGERERFLCATGNSQAEIFRKAFTTSGNEKIRPPEIIWVSPKGNSDILPETSEETLKKMTWIIRPEVASSTNVINPEGTVWIGSGRPSKYANYALYIYSENKLYVSPIELPSSVTGLASTLQGFAIIAKSDLENQHFLLQFDKKGGVTSTSKLTKEQYESTLTPKTR